MFLNYVSFVSYLDDTGICDRVMIEGQYLKDMTDTCHGRTYQFFAGCDI